MAARQERADEGACGRPYDCIGSRQINAGFAKPDEKSGLPADTDGAAASEDECACR